MFSRDFLEDSLAEARLDTIKILSLGDNWWPITNGSNQSDATAWATCFFLEVTSRIYGDGGLTIHCSKGKQSKSKEMISFFNYEYNRRQLMLDFVAAKMGESMPIRLTAESEMASVEDVSKFQVGSGYLWDFFKLLTVPSPVRLFMARVASSGQPAIERMDELIQRMSAMYRLHRGALFPKDVQFGAVIISGAQQDRDQTRILWSDGEDIRSEEILSFLL